MKTLPISGFRANPIQQNKKVTFGAKQNGANLLLNTLPARPIIINIPQGFDGNLRREAGALREVLIRLTTKPASLTQQHPRTT